MLDHKVVKKRYSISSLVNLVDAHGIIDHLDEAAVWAGGQDLVCLKPKRQLLNPKDLINLRDELHSKLLLSDII